MYLFYFAQHAIFKFYSFSTNNMISLFLWLNNTLLCIHAICSSVDRYLSLFYILALLTFWAFVLFEVQSHLPIILMPFFYLSILLLFLEVLCMLRTLTCLVNICWDNWLHTENRDDESSRSIQLFKPQCSVTSAPALLVYQTKKERTLERKNVLDSVFILNF